MKNILSAQPRKDFHLDVRFDDGARFDIDMRPFIKSGVSAALRDEAFFSSVQVENGYIFWENGFDFCPEALYAYAAAKAKRITDAA